MHVFKSTAAKPRKGWLSDYSWTLVQASHSAKRTLRQAKRTCLLSIMLATFWNWSATIPHTFMKCNSFASIQYTNVFIRCSSFSYARALKGFRDLRNSVRLATRLDRERYLAGVSITAARDAETGHIKPICHLTRTMSSLNAPVIKSIADEHGKLTVSQADYDARWTRYFSDVFHAKIVPDVSQIDVLPPADTHEMSAVAIPPPSLDRCIRALEELPLGKAVGPDGLAAEVIRTALPTIAPHFHQIIVEAWRATYVPIGWRGGRLAALYKKGSPSLCDNYRGLLVSDHMSKAFTSI